MVDITATTEPRSDQLNSDNLIGGKTLTIKVTKVSLVMGEQPVIINYENDEGKPYKPGKSMRRVLVHVWGADGNNFVGRSLTLYCDEKVTFGGMAVGGIRISHMSNIDKPITMALTATRAKRTPFTVKPLVIAADKPASTTITASQQGEIINLIKINKISPTTFLAEFGIEKSDQLPGDKFDAAKAWITAGSRGGAE
jgi:hypothetical protein